MKKDELEFIDREELKFIQEKLLKGKELSYNIESLSYDFILFSLKVSATVNSGALAYVPVYMNLTESKLEGIIYSIYLFIMGIVLSSSSAIIFNYYIKYYSYITFLNHYMDFLRDLSKYIKNPKFTPIEIFSIERHKYLNEVNKSLKNAKNIKKDAKRKSKYTKWASYLFGILSYASFVLGIIMLI